MGKPKGDDEGKKGGKSRVLMIVAVALVAVVGYKFFLAPKTSASPQAVPEVKEGEVMSLPELTLNLADPQPRYLRVGIALVLETGTTAEAMKKDSALASDIAVEVLSAKTYAQLRAPGAKQAVKEELSKKVREAYKDKKVLRVVFTSFVMQ